MKKLLVLLLVLCVSVWAGLNLKRDPGFLIIGYRGWSIEMPLWISLIALLFAYFVITLIRRILGALLSIFPCIRQRSKTKHLQRSRRKTRTGLLALSRGEWQQAEQDLVKGIHDNTLPLLNYLAAAKAAQEQGAFARRDEYLQTAHQLEQDHPFAVSLTQAQLQIDQQQLEQAVATLQHLHSLAPRHQFVLKLLHRLYFQLGDWTHCIELLPDLKKAKVLSNEEWLSFQSQAYVGLLRQQQSLQALQTEWQKLSRSSQKQPAILAAFCEGLLAYEEDERVAELLASVCRKQWQPELFALYARCPKHQVQALKLAEKWLQTHPDDPHLLAIGAQLCQQQSLWGKAKQYLQKSLSLAPCAERYAQMAELMVSLSEQEQALVYYRKAVI